MEISVIIPTYNGRDKIITCLNSLVSQSRKPDEVIVVIDGSIDDTKEVLASFSGFQELKIIERENGGRASSRNEGAANAMGNILIFFDDDMRPTSKSIEQHIHFHRRHQNAICGGNQIDEFKVEITDIQKYKSFLSRKWTSKYKPGINKLSTENLFLTAANFSIRKTDFDTLGGFNDELSDAEDFELGLRALQKGFEVYFDKDNIAWHDDMITCKTYIKRQKQYRSAFKKLSQINPLYEDLLGEREIQFNFLKRSIYYLFSWKFFSDQIDKNRLKIFPKKIRYKFYDIVITGLSKVYPNRNS